MRTVMRCLAAVMIGAPVSNAFAQDVSGAIGYAALVATPTAGVPPLVKQWMLDDPAQGIGIETEWGHLSGNGGHLDSFVSGVNFPLANGRADIGISAGYLNASCETGDCGSNYAIASGVVEGRVLSLQSASSMFALGLSGRIGFAKPTDATVWSASASVPLSLAIGARTGLQFVPFVSPGFGWGHVTVGSSSESGTRFMLGGGMGIVSGNSGWGVTVGAQKVFIDAGKVVFGAGVTWARR